MRAVPAHFDLCGQEQRGERERFVGAEGKGEEAEVGQEEMNIIIRI